MVSNCSLFSDVYPKFESERRASMLMTPRCSSGVAAGAVLSSMRVPSAVSLLSSSGIGLHARCQDENGIWQGENEADIMLFKVCLNPPSGTR